MTPIDVLIALDLSPDEVQEKYRQYLGLKNMHELVEIFDRMENYLPSLLELFRSIENKGYNKNDVIEVLRIVNTGQLPAIKKKLQDLTYADDWLENEIKKKKHQLSVLNQRTRELPYNGGGMYPLSSVHSTRALTYSGDSTYPPLMDNNNIGPISSTESNTIYEPIDRAAYEIYLRQLKLIT